MIIVAACQCNYMYNEYFINILLCFSNDFGRLIEYMLVIYFTQVLMSGIRYVLENMYPFSAKFSLYLYWHNVPIRLQYAITGPFFIVFSDPVYTDEEHRSI